MPARAYADEVAPPAGGSQTPAIQPTRVDDVCAGWHFTAGDTRSDTIVVHDPRGRKLLLQQKVGKAWKSLRTYALGSAATKRLKVVYPAAVWAQATTYWRYRIAADESFEAYTSQTIKAVSKRRTQNPKRYLQLADTNVSYHGKAGCSLTTGMEGNRVRMVRSRLGFGSSGQDCLYTASVKAAVKRFQKRHHIKATGKVDYRTWKALGFTEVQWQHADNSAHALAAQATRAASRSTLVAALIATAKSYRGRPYVDGGSGNRHYGVDCSGLVMQALYSIGLDPEPSNSYRHQWKAYNYESNNLYHNAKLKHYGLSSRKPGDLIFYYHNYKSYACHVAIYLGKGKIIDAWPGCGVSIRSMYINRHLLPQVVRPIL
jgi:cell wall-associated NlpC family hydrolase